MVLDIMGCGMPVILQIGSNGLVIWIDHYLHNRPGTGRAFIGSSTSAISGDSSLIGWINSRIPTSCKSITAHYCTVHKKECSEIGCRLFSIQHCKNTAENSWMYYFGLMYSCRSVFICQCNLLQNTISVSMNKVHYLIILLYFNDIHCIILITKKFNPRVCCVLIIPN